MQKMSFLGVQDPLTLQLSQNAVQSPQTNVITTPQVQQPQEDVIEVKTKEEEAPKEPKEKVPFRQKFLNFIASCKKIGVNIQEYGQGLFRGIGKSIAASIATVGGLFLGHQIFKAKKQNEGLIKVIGGAFKNTWHGLKGNLTREGLKRTLKSGRGIGTIIAGVLVFAGTMIKALYDTTLVANKKKHDVDEKYQKTPAVLKK